MSKNTFCKDFTKLYAFLIKAVQVPYESLEHNLVFEVSKKGTKSLRCKLLTNDDTGRTAALEVFVQVLIFLAAGKSYDLSSNICTKFLLACAVLYININAELALLKADELKRNDVGSLVEKLIERVLSVCSWLTEDDRSCYIINRFTETVYGFTVGLHITLLKMCRKTA